MEDVIFKDLLTYTVCNGESVQETFFPKINCSSAEWLQVAGSDEEADEGRVRFLPNFDLMMSSWVLYGESTFPISSWFLNHFLVILI